MNNKPTHRVRGSHPSCRNTNGSDRSVTHRFGAFVQNVDLQPVVKSLLKSQPLLLCYGQTSLKSIIAARFRAQEVVQPNLVRSREQIGTGDDLRCRLRASKGEGRTKNNSTRIHSIRDGNILFSQNNRRAVCFTALGWLAMRVAGLSCIHFTSRARARPPAKWGLRVGTHTLLVSRS